MLLLRKPKVKLIYSGNNEISSTTIHTKWLDIVSHISYSSLLSIWVVSHYNTTFNCGFLLLPVGLKMLSLTSEL